jgi:hypothetical protein
MIERSNKGWTVCQVKSLGQFRIAFGKRSALISCGSPVSVKKSPSLKAWTQEGQHNRGVVQFRGNSNQHRASRDIVKMATQFMHMISEFRQRWAIIRLGVLHAGFDALKIDMNMEQVISHALEGNQQQLHGADLFSMGA